MATKTGNSDTTGTTTDSVKIPTASSGFSTMVNPKKVSPSDCENDRQPEMAIWLATKTGNTYISGIITDRRTIPTANLGFSTTPSAKKLIPDDYDNDRQPETAVQTCWSPVLQFLVVDRCRNHLANLLSSSSSWKIPNLALELRRYLFQRCNCLRFWGSYRYFRLSVATVLTCQHCFPPIHLFMPQICRWNFNCTFRSFRDTSISGFGRHFRLSDWNYWNRLATLPASLPWSNAVGLPLEL